MNKNRESIQKLLVDEMEKIELIPDKVFEHFNKDEISVIYNFSYIFPDIDGNHDEDRSSAIFNFIEEQDIKNDQYQVSIYSFVKNIAYSCIYPKHYTINMNVVCKFEFYDEDLVASLKLYIIK